MLDYFGQFAILNWCYFIYSWGDEMDFGGDVGSAVYADVLSHSLFGFEVFVTCWDRQLVDLLPLVHLYLSLPSPSQHDSVECDGYSP